MGVFLLWSVVVKMITQDSSEVFPQLKLRNFEKTSYIFLTDEKLSRMVRSFEILILVSSYNIIFF